MIAAWMLYCLAIGLVFSVVGVALERGLHLAGRPTRWAWIAALVGSFLIPTTAWLRPDAFSTVAVPIPPVVVTQATNVVAPWRAEAATPAPTFSLSDLDGALRWGWAVASAVLLCVFGAAALRLAVLRRSWRASLVDGRAVLVSENVGPAVTGLWRPKVIVPAWALALGEPQRRLMLSHEEEHVRAADPWLLTIGAAALVLMPWHPALWWQARRLRLAVEIDCDTRVLARGGKPPEYGELLLQVGRRRMHPALAGLALGEPVSFLEHRIRRMATALPRWRWAGAVAALTIAVGAVVGACEAPRPVYAATLQGQAPAEVLVHHGGVSSDDVRPLLRRYFGPSPARLADSAVLVWFVIDRRGAVAARGTLPRDRGDTDLSAAITARRIPGYDSLRVGSLLLHAERNLPPTIILRLGDPPIRVDDVVRRIGPPSAPARTASDTYPGPSADYVRGVARQYHPEVFARPHQGAAVALVFDAQNRVVGHAAGWREPRDQSCEDVVKRLLPQFRGVRFSSGGCADTDGGVTVYWGSTPTP